MSAEEVAKAFVSHYYTAFDSNPEQLMGLFVRSPVPVVVLTRFVSLLKTSLTLLIVLLLLLLLKHDAVPFPLWFI